MRERKRVLFGTGYVFLSTVVALAIALLLRPILVRILGLEQYGLFVLATSLLGIAALASDFGIGSALTKFVAEEGDQARRAELVTSALIASLLAGFISTGILLTLASFVEPSSGIAGMSSLLFVLAWQVPFALAAATCLASLSGLRRMRAYALGAIATSVVAFVLVGSFVVFGRTAVDAAIGTAAAAVASFAILIIPIRRYLRWPGLRGLRSSVGGLATFGVHLSATNAASVLLYQLDVVILAWFTGNGVLVGYYSIAMLLARALWIIPSSISFVGYPALSEYTKENRPARTEAFVDRALRFSAGIVGLAVLILAYFGSEIIVGLFGTEALPAYGPLLVLLVGAGLLGVAKSVATGIPSSGRPEVGFRIAIVGLGVSLVLNLVLVPVVGIAGAALSTSVAYAVLAVLVIVYVRRLLVVTVRGRWLAEAVGWVAILVSPLVAVLGFAPGATMPRWILGGIAAVGFLAVLFMRLWPREDTAYLVGALRDALRQPETR